MFAITLRRCLTSAACVVACAATTSVWAQTDASAVEAMEAYLDFVDYQGGNIAMEQIPQDQWARYFIIDTRSADQYAKGHIPNAVNIEWRRVLAQRSQIPKDRPVLIYCNTGTLSSQAGLALRFAGWDRVQILHGGLEAYRVKFPQ